MYASLHHVWKYLHLQGCQIWAVRGTPHQGVVPPIKAWPPQPLLYTRKVKTLNTMVHFLVTFVHTNWMQKDLELYMGSAGTDPL